MKHMREYEVRRNYAQQIHGNTKTALPFFRMRVGDVFVVDTEAEYTRACSARAHYVKMMKKKFNELITIKSSQIKEPIRDDGGNILKDDSGNIAGYEVVGYMFKRVNYVPPKTTQMDRITIEDDDQEDDDDG